MAGKKYRKSASKCPEPLNTLVDIAVGAALGAVVKHKVKKDFERGKGPESLHAARVVFGMGSFRRGGAGLVHLGGLLGAESAAKDIQNKKGSHCYKSSTVDKAQKQTREVPQRQVRKSLWRAYCEDGADYGVDPCDYETADDYQEALNRAKGIMLREEVNDGPPIAVAQADIRYRWRKYCEDGTSFGLNPNDYETLDDYVDALNVAKEKG